MMETTQGMPVLPSEDAEERIRQASGRGRVLQRKPGQNSSLSWLGCLINFRDGWSTMC